MLLCSGTLRRPPVLSEVCRARGAFRNGPLLGRQPRRRLCSRLQARPCARYGPEEALAEGDGGAVAAARSAAPAAEEASGSGWRSWLPFSWVTSSGSGSSGTGSDTFKSSIASSEAALALLESDGMALALALVPTGLTAPQPAQLSPTLEAELDAVAQQAQQKQERTAAAQMSEGPTLIVRSGAAAAQVAELAPAPAAAAAGEESAEESPLLLPGGIPLHHPVLELLRQRNWEASLPGHRSDPYKIGAHSLPSWCLSFDCSVDMGGRTFHRLQRCGWTCCCSFHVAL